jgi:ABC-type glycerol-3-phosphate transport system substrate-binding protein
VALDSGESPGSNPLVTSLAFYLRFGQPANTLYSWNRSFMSDRSEFISEDLVFYFGYASEARELAALNPNLNFDIAEVPQGAGADVRRTYGRIYALSPLRSSDNITGAFTVMSALGSEAVISQLAEAVQMVPARRSLVTLGSNDVYLRVAYRSAPITYGWLNPGTSEVDAIFTEMVSDVNENRSGVEEAVGTAQEKIRRAYD